MSTQKTKELRLHSYAKYDANHKLTCIVCNVIIKNESSWNSHLASISHKETLKKIRELKEKALKTESSSGDVNRAASLIKSKSPTTSNFKPKSILKKESSFNFEQESTTINDKKRSVGVEGKVTISKGNVPSNIDTDNSIKKLIEQARVKRVKYNDDSLTTEQSIPQTSTIPPDFFDSKISVDEEATITNKLPSDFFDTKISVDEEEDESEMTSKLPSDFYDSKISVDKEEDESAMTSKLPSDFFDDTAPTVNQQIDTSTQKIEIVQEETSSLPADFFDNPSLNSTSVKVSATTEIDEQEWINFQKEISKETQVSNQISNADDEQLQRDRDEMQEREQEFCLARLEKLKNVAKRVKENRGKNMMVDTNSVNAKDFGEGNIDDTSDEDIDDDFMDGWMDWRAQKIL
ncbi:4806_t:CDS:2 [Rhizophagus irregularis]|nr:4806_t:CDS:2 [Rhizophagus irregularis]